MKRTNVIAARGVIVMALLAGACPAVARSSLPLRHGVYIDASTDCRGAPSAGQTWFGGGYVLHASHASCKLLKVARQSPSRYRVTMRCSESGAPDISFVLVNHVTIVSPTEYRLANRFGRSNARWCWD